MRAHGRQLRYLLGVQRGEECTDGDGVGPRVRSRVFAVKKPYPRNGLKSVPSRKERDALSAFPSKLAAMIKIATLVVYQQLDNARPKPTGRINRFGSASQ